MIRGYGRKIRRKIKTCRYTDEVAELLAREIRKDPRYRNCKVEAMGPFGLGATCSVSVRRNVLPKNEELLGYLTITYGPNNTFEYVDYSAPKKSTYPKNSIGDINGFNDVTYPLPTDLKEAVELVFKDIDRKTPEGKAEFSVDSIVWDTDGYSARSLGLPREATVYAEDEDEVVDVLSDEFGYCIEALNITRKEETA